MKLSQDFILNGINSVFFTEQLQWFYFLFISFVFPSLFRSSFDIDYRCAMLIVRCVYFIGHSPFCFTLFYSLLHSYFKSLFFLSQNIVIQTNKRCLGWIYSSFRWWIVENLIRIENEFWRWEASLSMCVFFHMHFQLLN